MSLVTISSSLSQIQDDEHYYDTKMKLITLSGHERKVTKVMFNDDDDLIFTAAADRIVCVWDSRTGERLGTYNGHKGIINDFDVDHTSSYLLSGSGDSSIIIWKVETGQIMHQFGTYAPIISVQWSCGNKLFLATSRKFRNQQSCLHIYRNPMDDNQTTTDILEHEQKEQIKNNKSIISIPIENDAKQLDFNITKGVWSPLNDQIFVLCTDNTMRIIDVEKGRQIKKVIFDQYTYNQLNINRVNGLEMELTDFQYNADNVCTAAISSRNKMVKIYDIYKWDKPICRYQCDMEINAIAIHPKLNMIAMGGGQEAQKAALIGDKGKYDPVFYHKIFEEQIGMIDTNCFSPLNSMNWNSNGSQIILGYEQGEALLFTMNNQFDKQFRKRGVEFTAIPQQHDNDDND